ARNKISGLYTERNVRCSAPKEARLEGKYWSGNRQTGTRSRDKYTKEEENRQVATTSPNSEKVSNVIGDSSESSNSLAAINSSNIGFQLLKKHGWKEGTGLGIAEQSILEPLQAEPKHNKQGLGSEKPAKRKAAQPQDTSSEEVSKKSKKLSKKLRKMIEHEKRLAENEFERAFRREFWPDNI
ncbi:unnamed protein product, partial [Arabidopsis halleri]